MAASWAVLCSDLKQHLLEHWLKPYEGWCLNKAIAYPVSFCAWILQGQVCISILPPQHLFKAYSDYKPYFLSISFLLLLNKWAHMEWFKCHLCVACNSMGKEFCMDPCTRIRISTGCFPLGSLWGRSVSLPRAQPYSLDHALSFSFKASPTTAPSPPQFPTSSSTLAPPSSHNQEKVFTLRIHVIRLGPPGQLKALSLSQAQDSCSESHL